MKIVYGQSRNSIWCFGDSTGIDFNNVSAPFPFTTSMDSRGSCCSISDKNGNLLFYANTRATISGYTTQVWNMNHQLMQNGDSIAGRGWYNELVIIPFPNDSEKYYLFCNSITSIFGLYYSIIDMNADSGRGSVVSKNYLLGDTLCDAMTAIKHGNGKDWWLIVMESNPSGTKRFYEYLITSDTIVKFTFNIGGLSSTNIGNLGFSKDGKLLYFVSFTGLIELFDFDRCTGQITNANIVHQEYQNNIAWYSGAEFSPNKNILYIADARDTFHLFQFDLTAANIWNSKDTLATISNAPNGGGTIRLGPDDKIYWSCEWGPSGWFPYPYQSFMYSPYNMNLSVINDPDVLGSGCNLSMYSFYLNMKRTYWGLPNNPNYDLAPLQGSVCDTIINVNEIDKLNIRLYPSPAATSFTIDLSTLPESNLKIIITDIFGNIVFSSKTRESKMNIECSNYNPGFYIVTVGNNHFTFNKSISVIH